MSVNRFSLDDDAIDARLAAISRKFEKAHPEAVLRWALTEFGAQVAFATSFGAEGCVLIHILAGITRSARIFYLDTGLLFPETYALRDRLAARYGLRFERRQPALSLAAQAEKFGEQLWERQPDLCCQLRKVEPLKEALAGLSAWITSIRRDQSETRRNINVVERDAKFGLIKINPLAHWSAHEVWEFIKRHDLPYNRLHDEGYPSLGCQPCTTPIQIGESERAGRWRGRGKTECGIHQ